MTKIIFTSTIDSLKEYYPQPAQQMVPLWYKNTESYIGGKKEPSGDGKTTATVKRCMPVFDAITAGYLILSQTDIYISQKPNPNGEGLIPWYEWASNKAITFHPVVQAENHPNKNGFDYPKFMNTWSIKTPPGYSVLITQPMHREAPFTILDGVVDTDTYTAPINFPFVLNDAKFEGYIPAGTPLAQIIPFKRESWKMEIGSEKEIKEQNIVTKKINSKFFDVYKSIFRQPKEYK